MKIGIIGPGKLDSLKKVNPDYLDVISKLAEKLADKNHDVYLTPDKGSSSELFAQKYLKLNGNVFEILPLDDKLGYDWVNTKLGEHINCGVWRNQPGKLNDETEILICIGYGAGVLAEISYSKYPKTKPVYIIKELISKELPEELKRSLDLRYVFIDSLVL